MQPSRRSAAVVPSLVLGLALVACSSTPTTTSTPDPTPRDTEAATPVATDAPVESAGGQPPASDAPAAFDCEYPFVEQATVARANITDVRVGAHDGFDRVVFEFAGGTPEFTLDRAEPPFVQDGSGFPVEVDGESFLQLTMRGGTKQMDDGTSSYDGPTEFEPGFTTLVHLVEGGDFEAQSTWYFGLSHDACVSIQLLDDEPRLVIDLNHPGVGALSAPGS